jgi:(1->4)-alpha-D-glucan 1-alpha-D-glucosylmutase
VVPRLVYGLYRDGAPADWGATEIGLPSAGPWRNVFTDEVLSGRERILAGDLFHDFPVAVLIGPVAAWA